MNPVKYRCGVKWELTIDALYPVGTACDHRESWVRGPGVSLDKRSEPFGQIRQLASHAREDARLFPRRGETSGENFEAPAFCLSPSSDEPSVDRQGPFGSGVPRLRARQFNGVNPRANPQCPFSPRPLLRRFPQPT